MLIATEVKASNFRKFKTHCHTFRDAFVTQRSSMLAISEERSLAPHWKTSKKLSTRATPKATEHRAHLEKRWLESS